MALPLALSIAVLFATGTQASAQPQADGPALIQWAPATGGHGSWRLQAEYHGPRDTSGFGNRPIDIVALEARHVWALPWGFEGALGLGILNATGQRLEIGQPARASGATGLLLGGALRWAPVRIGPVTPFAEGAIDFLYTAGHPFPAGGTSVNGFVRWGGGIDVRVSDRLSLEAGFRAAHISNGGGFVPYNPAWDGHGGFLGVSWRPKG